MSRRVWKRVQAGNLNQAMELCLEFAREKHNRSTEGVADLMGVNHWTLYKWMSSGSMPANLIRPFEHACGIELVSRWLAASSNKLVIDMPRAAKSGPGDIMLLQAAINDAVGALIKFYDDKCNAMQTISAVQTALECLVWHRSNVSKYGQDELPFEDEK